MLESAEGEMVGLISCEIIFCRIPTYIITIPQRHTESDRRTDGQLALAIPRSARFRAVKRLMVLHS